MPVVFVAYYDIDIAATHIPGVANRTEDHLSRNNMSQFFLTESTGEPTTNFTTTITHLDHDNPRHGLDISSPHRAVQHYYINGLAPSTHRSYKAGQSRYLAFCHQIQCSAIPTSASTMLLRICCISGKRKTLLRYN